MKDMTIKELRAIAEERGVDVSGLKRKADIAAAIEDAEVTPAEVIDEDAPKGELAVSYSPGIIQANFAALEEHVDAILKEYEGWEPSAEDDADVKQCKAHRAYLNGIAGKIDAKRKECKTRYLMPLSAFEAECNRLRDKVKAVASRLSDVEKAADEARREAKQAALEEHYREYAGTLADAVPYGVIADPKWLNKSVSLAKACDELEWRVKWASLDLQALKRLNLEFGEQAEARFYQTLDLGEATAFADRLAEDARRVEEVRAEMDAYAEPPIEEPPTIEPLEAEPPVEETPAAGSPRAIAERELAAMLADCPDAKLVRLVHAMKEARRDEGAGAPCSMQIDAASDAQLRAVGELCGLVGVTGTFKRMREAV